VSVTDLRDSDVVTTGPGAERWARSSSVVGISRSSAYAARRTRAPEKTPIERDDPSVLGVQTAFSGNRRTRDNRGSNVTISQKYDTSTGRAKRPTRRRRAFLAGTATLAGVALAAGIGIGAGVAGAAPRAGSTHVLRLFARTASFTYITAAGKDVKVLPKPVRLGDQIEETDLDYVGDYAHHAAKWTDTDVERCIFLSKASVPCYVEIAVRGSMILAKGTLGESAPGITTFRVVGGTGAYAGATGTAVAKDTPGGDDDVVITVHVP
jgi:hypothetical protein